MRWRELVERLLTREVLTFLAVGGTGYVVDVVAFNLLRSTQPFADQDPALARTLAVAMAMCVTFTGNRSLTWRDHASGGRRREVALFVLFNVIGLALGTIFRYVTYKRFVFAAPHPDPSLAAHDPAQLKTRGVSVASCPRAQTGAPHLR